MAEAPNPEAGGSKVWNNDEEATEGILQHIDRQTAKAATVAPNVGTKKPEEPEQPEESPESAEETQEAQPEGEEPTEPEAEEIKRKVRVRKDDGEFEEVELPVSELEKGYMRERDYHFKRQQDAKRAQEAEATIRQKEENLAQQYATQAQTLHRALFTIAAQEFQAAGVDITNQMQVNSHLSKLSREDPAEAVRLTNRLNEVNAALNLANSHLSQERTKLNQRRVDELSKKIQESIEEVQSISGWTDQRRDELVKTGLQYGFTKEELTEVMNKDNSLKDGYIPAADHRFTKLLNDAYLYRQQQQRDSEAKKLAEKKVAEAPKVLKPGSPAKSDNRSRQLQEADKKLKRSGKIDDAARLFEQML